jgi:hypothetical protein
MSHITEAEAALAQLETFLQPRLARAGSDGASARLQLALQAAAYRAYARELDAGFSHEQLLPLYVGAIAMLIASYCWSLSHQMSREERIDILHDILDVIEMAATNNLMKAPTDTNVVASGRI